MLELDWDDINAVEQDQEETAQDSSLKESDWEIVEVPKPKIDINQFNEIETILYNTETRQRLLNDLEELEFFLR